MLKIFKTLMTNCMKKSTLTPDNNQHNEAQSEIFGFVFIHR